MNRNNLYSTKIDFCELANTYDALKSKLIYGPSGVTLDFRDSESQRLLTKALLHRDFGLTVDLPQNRLCPPVPNRFNYIKWLNDISESLSSEEETTNRLIRVVDIGTGASAIYPLLGCACNPSWMFIATETDIESWESARRNVSANSLEDRIEVVSVKPGDGILVPLLSDPNLKFASLNASIERADYPSVDFTMCNPPFYTSEAEIASLAEMKEFGPMAVCTGSIKEMVTEGGEQQFVKTMIDESLIIRGRCRWYTSMLGKQSSLISIAEYLRQHKIDNYAITQFLQGTTRRWAIGWSFMDVHLRDDCARFHSTSLQHLMPPPNCASLLLTKYASRNDLVGKLLEILESLDDLTICRVSEDTIVVESRRNTWSRAERRKRARTGDYNPTADTLGPNMVAHLSVVEGEGKSEEGGKSFRFQGRWFKGVDRGLWESFWSHVIRKLSS